MAGYESRGPERMAFEETRRHLDCDLRDITSVARDIALARLSREHNDNLQAGIIKSLRMQRVDLKSLVAESLTYKLTGPDEEAPEKTSATGPRRALRPKGRATPATRPAPRARPARR